MPGRRSPERWVRRRDVDLQHVELPVEGQLGELPLRAETGVVDQHVHLDARRLQVRQQAVRSVRLGQVGGEDLRLDLVGLSQFRREGFQCNSLARDQNEPAALGGKAPRQLQADAGRRAGDKNRFCETHELLLRGRCT